MHLTRSRRAPEPPSPAPAPLHVVEHGDRWDLLCTFCGKTVAYDVHPDRVSGHDPFYLDVHTPFCLRTKADESG